MNPFNHGHVTHHHHRRDDDESPVTYPPPGSTFSSFDNQPPPPQPPFYAQPPPPPHHHPETHVFHTSHVSQDFNYPPPSSTHHPYPPDPSTDFGYPPPPTGPPGNATVHHVAHETHHPTHINPHFPTSVHHVSHQGPNVLNTRPTVRVLTKAAPDYALTIRNAQVILARSDPTDQYQHWYKDEKYSTRVKDEEGSPAFSLVNKATGEALKHSIGATHPVRLIPYNPDYLDESILWTESKDLGGGFRTIRMVNNVHLNVDAFHGDKNSGGVHDGTTIVLWDWNKGDNQLWKIVPY